MLACHVFLAVVAISLCPGISAYYGNMFRPRGRFPRMPTCSSASRPCRLKAELVSNDPLVDPDNQLRRVISRQLCSCGPSSPPCSSNWDNNDERVIVRELRTNGNINMTFSMMFCAPLRPENQRWCQAGDVALRLRGLSSVPTEVESIACTCTDRRPLMLHRQFRGNDFLQYDDYVCAMHKRRCNVEWNPDECLIHHEANQTDFYPCKCPEFTVCRSTSDIPFNKDFRCLPVE